MSISITGLGSGLEYDSWIEQLVAIKQSEIDVVNNEVAGVNKKITALSTLKSDYTSLLTSVESFTTSLSNDDVFNKKAVTSSFDGIAATVTSAATSQNISVSVSQLATSTTAKGVTAAASYVDSATKMSDISGGSFKAGAFSVYVDGAKSSINIASDATMDDVLGQLNSIDGVVASLSADGKLTIGGADGKNVVVGSTADTSNFSKVMSLVSKTTEGVTSYVSSKSIFDTNTSGPLTATSFNAGSITEGTFTIGTEEFTVTSTTTMDSLLKQINASEKAGVSASWDANAGKLILQAKEEGAISINIEAGTSNFTDIMGFTNEGNLVSGSQTLGTNAVLTINGTQITSSSNTVTSDISGIKGLTLELNSVTTTAATVDIANDSSAVVAALEGFVNAYNTAISDSVSATKTTGFLHGESILVSMKNNLKSIVGTTAGNNDIYKTLGAIGITTGAFSTDTKAETNTLKIDAEKLKAAIEADPDAVKNLLVGDPKNNVKGVFTKLETVLENATDVTKGYFAKRDDAFDQVVDKLESKIERKTLAMEKYKAQLDARFAVMDELISKLNANASTMDSFFNQINGTSSKDK